MATTAIEACPLCSLPGLEVEAYDYGKRKHVNCPCCGEFRITSSAASLASKKGITSLLSAWIRARAERNAEVPEMSITNIDSIASTAPNYSVLDKQALLLRAIASRSKFPGQDIDVEPRLDYPLAWCANESELAFHMRTLIERGLLLQDTFTLGRSQRHKFRVGITANGWTNLDESNRSRSLSTQAFVAMSFAHEMQSAWQDGIRHAITKAGYKPFRTDAQPSIDRIDVQIMSEIRRSNSLIADVTLQRPGVYFEAGFAIGLGIPVYWTVRRDDLENIHFDTRQYNHIVWETPDELQKRLYDFIYAVSGPAAAT